MPNAQASKIVPALLLLGFCMIVSRGITAVAADSNPGDLERPLTEAFETLREGVAQGGDASEAKQIADGLNAVFSLLDRNPSSIDRSQQDIAQKIGKRANTFVSRSLEAYLIRMVVTWAIVPVISFFVAVIILVTHSWYVDRSNKLLLSMAVVLREKDEKT